MDKLTPVSYLRPRFARGVYEKVGGKEGSTPGGWYREQSGELYYLKLYTNPNNARIEYIANCIYNRIGIRAATSELLVSGGDLWVASKKIGQGVHATKEEQKKDVEFRGGFVADAYLANWDVTGELFDNIIKDNDGRLYRIDNGGCGPIRANGKPKPFSADKIEELDDMRNPKFHAGQVFFDVTDAEVAVQAKRILSNLDDDFLQGVCKDSGLSADAGDAMLKGLLGRKECLKTRLNFL